MHWIYDNKDTDYVNNHSVNPLYLTIDKLDGYNEKKKKINTIFFFFL